MLEISHLDVFYGDIQALWDVSIKVDNGELVALVGSNGAGKTTLMQTIAGLLKPGAGSILFNGVRLDRLPTHKIVESGVCLVPEGRRLFPQMTILENLEVGASVTGARKMKRKGLDLVYRTFPLLETRSHQKAGTLSGGEQQMLAIGRALMSRPRLLLVDEMSLGLSPLATQTISEVIKGLNIAEELTILLVEQDVSLSLSLARRGYILENGRVVGQGKAKDLMCNEDVKEAYLGLGKVEKA